MNRVLVKLYVPLVEEEYDVWLPLNKPISIIVKLLIKGISEFSSGRYNPTVIPNLYDKLTGEKYNINSKLKDTSIKNGSEIILI